LFDTGVVRTLRRPPRVSEASADFGELFEPNMKAMCWPEMLFLPADSGSSDTGAIPGNAPTSAG